jgi:hypothetical protein
MVNESRHKRRGRLSSAREGSRVLPDTLVSSLELSWRAPYRNFTGHDKTGTCQWQNPLANASEPAPRSLAQEHLPESRTCGEASQGAQP